MTSSASNPSTDLSWPLRATAGYYMTFIILGLLMAAIAPVIPILAERTHSGLDQLSSALAVTSLGYMAGAFVGGRLYDRYKGHKIMAGVLFATGGLAFLLPFIPLLWLLALVLFLLGVMEGAMDTGGNGLLVWVHGLRVAPFMNGLHFFFGVGAFLAPIAIVQVACLVGQEMGGFWLIAILAVAVGFYLWPLPSPTIPAHVNHPSAGRAKPLLVGLFVLFFFLYVGAEISCGNWIYTYALELSLATSVTAAYLTSAFWGSFTVGRLMGIPLAARFKPQHIILVDLLACLLFMGVILIWRESAVMLWIGTLGIGLSMASIFPATMSFAEQCMSLTGKITGWFLVGTGAGGMILPWLSGQLFESQGFMVLMWIVLSDLLLSLGLLVFLMVYRSRSV